MTRTQWLVIGFFATVLAALGVILVADPSIYTSTVPVPPLAFFLPVAALIAVLVTGVVKRWRWTFWLVLVAFAAGVLRVPAAALELAGVARTASPAWYTVLQGAIGVAQALIALQMWIGYRRGGYWARP